jgi:hypothetical protein
MYQRFIISAVSFFMIGCAPSMNKAMMLDDEMVLEKPASQVRNNKVQQDLKKIASVTITEPARLLTFRNKRHFSVVGLLGRSADNIMTACLNEAGEDGTKLRRLTDTNVDLQKVQIKPRNWKVGSELETKMFFVLNVHNRGRLSETTFAALNTCVERDAFKNARVKMNNVQVVH